MDNMTILDRLVSIKINAEERTFANLKGNPGCNQYFTKATYLESGIKQLIIEIQNVIFTEQTMENRVDNTVKIEEETDESQEHTLWFSEEQYVNEWCDYYLDAADFSNSPSDPISIEEINEVWINSFMKHYVSNVTLKKVA
jgi:hypothetical protein